MVPPLSLQSRVCLASQLLANRPNLPVREIEAGLSGLRERHACGLGFSHDIHQEAQAIARDVAGPVNPRELGREDLYHLLAQVQSGHLTYDSSESPFIETTLRERLAYPVVDPEGLQLRFRQIQNQEASQVFYVEIRPQNLDSSKAALVFVTGLHHPTVVYLQMLVALARAEGRRVISVDLPSMGGTRNANHESTYVSDAMNAVREVIQREISPGEHFSMMGHSLGTLPVRSFYLDEDAYNSDRGLNQTRRILDRAVLVAPVPSQEERQMGDRIRPSFSAAVVGQILFRGGSVSPSRLNELFFQHHSPADQAWIHQALAQERFETSLWGALSHYFSAYLNPVLDRVGTDERLRIVFPNDDQLMQLDNRADWENHRGVFIVRGEAGEAADHSFLAGREVNPRHLEVLRSALNDSLDVSQPLLNRGTLYRRVRPDLQAYIPIDSRGGFGVGGRFGIQSGLLAGQSLALRWQSGVELDLRLPGSENDRGLANHASSLSFSDRSSAQGRFYTEFGLESFHLPAQVGLGAYVQTRSPLSGFDLNLDTGVYAYLRITPENLVSLEARFQYPFYVLNGVQTPPEFQFRLGIPFLQ